MNDTRLLYNIRHKEIKTQEDELLLKYHEILATICEYLVSESKWHISSEDAIKKIREIISI